MELAIYITIGIEAAGVTPVALVTGDEQARKIVQAIRKS